MAAVHPSWYPISGGYPFLNIALWCQVPYAEVLKYSDQCARALKIGTSMPASVNLNPTVEKAVQDWTTLERERAAGKLGSLNA